jgi:hypothetical protein
MTAMKRHKVSGAGSEPARSTANDSQSSNTQPSESQAEETIDFDSPERTGEVVTTDPEPSAWPDHLQGKRISSHLAGMAVHNAAKAIPRMNAKEFADLKADIEAEGKVKVPVILNTAQNTILDGRHRWEIAYDLGFKFSQVPIEVFAGDEAAIRHLIWQRNGLRRQMELNADQRAALAAKVLGQALREEARTRQKKGGAAKVPLKSAEAGEAGDKLANEAGVGRDKARAALRLAEDNPKALQDVIEGKQKLTEGAKKGSTKKRKPPAVKSLEDRVWLAFDRMMRSKTIQRAEQTAALEILRRFIDDILRSRDKKVERNSK